MRADVSRISRAVRGRLAAEPALAACALGLLLLSPGATWSRTAHTAAHFLFAPLERRFSAASLDDPHAFTGVIALGGGSERIREACRLAQRLPHLRVFVSGAGDETAVRAMLGMELASCRLMLEDDSRNTHANARLSKSSLAPAPDQRWLLVTSAAHMPRAIGAFRKAGFPVEPWPVYDTAPGAASMLTVARHEWLGLLAYWLTGRSSELFPRP